MARPRKNLNSESKEVIAEKFLDEGPEIEKALNSKVVVAKSIPQYEKIIFQNLRDPGVPLCFHYHSATHPLKHYELFHGHEHDLPSEIIHYLEGEARGEMYTCHSRMYGSRMRPDGKSENFVNGYKPYFQCKRVRA